MVHFETIDVTGLGMDSQFTFTECFGRYLLAKRIRPKSGIVRALSGYDGMKRIVERLRQF